MPEEYFGPRTTVQVGKSVQLTHGDVVLLKQYAQEMDRLVFHQSKGWFLEYMKAHRHARHVINRIMKRSHAS